MRPIHLMSLVFLLMACDTSERSAADNQQTDDTAGVAAADPGVARAQIDSLRNLWKAAAERKDAAAAAAIYADDAVMAGGQAPLASGRSEIQNNLTQMFATGTVESIDSKEVAVGGDVAYDYGTYRLRVAPPNQQAQTVNGHYVVTLRRQSDGTWQITRHIDAVPPARP